MLILKYQQGVNILNFKKKGAGYTFGERATRYFCHLNSLSHISRAHQLCMEGYQILFNDLLSTVWSAPNYCYRAGNLASVLNISPGLERSFIVFEACPDDLRDIPNKGENVKLDISDIGPMLNNTEVKDYFI